MNSAASSAAAFTIGRIRPPAPARPLGFLFTSYIFHGGQDGNSIHFKNLGQIHQHVFKPKLNPFSGMFAYTELRKSLCMFSKQQPGRARPKFLATTYKDFFSALYVLFNLASRANFVQKLGQKLNPIELTPRTPERPNAFSRRRCSPPQPMPA